ncbi:MAG: CBO0543 family protein [Tuberibacillus sp.]
MVISQPEMYQEFVKKTVEMAKLNEKYWALYSNPGTWQFWIAFLMLVVPLIILYFRLDRKKILLLGFYGYNIHVWFGYLDYIGTNQGWWGYPYHLIPFLRSFVLDGSVVPVTFMLVYQWTINHKKNYYLYSFITAFVFAFIFKPILHEFGLFSLNVRYVDLFLVYCIVILISRMITSIFLYISKKEENFV